MLTVHVCGCEILFDRVSLTDVHWVLPPSATTGCQHWVAVSLRHAIKRIKRNASEKNEGRWRVSDGMGE